MYIFAYACLLFALLLSLGGGFIALLQLWEGRNEHLGLISKAQWLISASLLTASALLLHALFWEDYRLEYVASYTDSFLPTFYRLTAFWAGQPGSMLFWALTTALCGSLFVISGAHRRLEPVAALWFWVSFYAVLAFFCLLLTGWSNPFIMLDPAPADGNGLNPLLQNPGMIFHPPLLFMGYAAFTVPACLAMAWLLAPGRNFHWHMESRAFILAGWLLLAAGIILGAWWAYMELGWGGYWAWDPVENASLLPWLAGTAALHILAITRRTGKLGRTSAALMVFSLIAAFFATYITRSGVIQSVHAFGDGGVGAPLLIFILSSALFTILAALSAPSSGQALNSPLSREGSLMLATWIFLSLAIIIALATLWPLISQLFGDAPQGLDASFYNRVCLPLAVFLICLLCICNWQSWNAARLAQNRLAPCLATCGAFLASLFAIWFAGYQKPLPLVAASGAIAALCAMAMHMFDKSIWKNAFARGAMGAHFGVALLALGVAFSGPYTTEKDILFGKGQTQKFGPYQITLLNVRDGGGAGYDYLQARLEVRLDGDVVGILEPERRIYAKFGSMQFSEVDVISTLGQDIYASLLGMDEDYRTLVKLSIEPLVNWIWIGGALMCLLPLLGLGFRRKKPGPT